MSLDAVERQSMPFRGESGGIAAGQGMGQVPDSAFEERLADARRQAAEHADHDAPRAPRPDKMQR